MASYRRFSQHRRTTCKAAKHRAATRLLLAHSFLTPQALSSRFHHPRVQLKAEWAFPLSEPVSAKTPNPSKECPTYCSRSKHCLDSNIHMRLKTKFWKSSSFKNLACSSLVELVKYNIKFPSSFTLEMESHANRKKDCWAGTPPCSTNCCAKASTQADTNSSSFLCSCSLWCQLRYSKWERVIGNNPEGFSTTFSCWCINLCQDTNRGSKTQPHCTIPNSLNFIPGVKSQGHRETPRAMLCLEAQDVVTADLFRGAQYSMQHNHSPAVCLNWWYPYAQCRLPSFPTCSCLGSEAASLSSLELWFPSAYHSRYMAPSTPERCL